MEKLDDLPLELLQSIFNKLDFESQITFRQLCKYFYEGLRIYDLLNIDYKYKIKLNDNILKKFEHIKYLDASYNSEFKNGKKDLSWYIYIQSPSKITDNGIGHLNLITLNASCNLKITNIGIKHMNLCQLSVSFNENITDEGIKHMNLHTLYTRGNSKITNDGIKNMDLRQLYIFLNRKITREGIKHMTSCKLNP